LKIIIIYLIIITAFASCTKVIHVNIKDADKKYVIEGTITDNNNSCKVRVTKSLNVSDTNYYNILDNATVTVQEDNKNTVSLTFNSSDGFYRAPISGTPGHTYHLTVIVDGITFTASSTMPQKVYMDTLYVTQRAVLGKERKIATVEFKDPPGLGNAYRFTQYVNGEKENTIFAIDDNLIDRRKVIYELLNFSDTKYTLETDDQLRVEMRCIDYNNYLFWYSLSQSSLGDSQSASPGNPITNITGGALGYFSANTFEANNIAVQ
jgi:hypothetical protein